LVLIDVLFVIGHCHLLFRPGKPFVSDSKPVLGFARSCVAVRLSRYAASPRLLVLLAVKPLGDRQRD
jgi:hypothetical protein